MLAVRSMDENGFKSKILVNVNVSEALYVYYVRPQVGGQVDLEASLDLPFFQVPFLSHVSRSENYFFQVQFLSHVSTNFFPGPTRRGSLQLWQFLVTLLDDPTNTGAISWTGRGMEFKLIEPEEVKSQ